MHRIRVAAAATLVFCRRCAGPGICPPRHRRRRHGDSDVRAHCWAKWPARRRLTGRLPAAPGRVSGPRIAARAPLDSDGLKRAALPALAALHRGRDPAQTPGASPRLAVSNPRLAAKRPGAGRARWPRGRNAARTRIPAQGAGPLRSLVCAGPRRPGLQRDPGC